MSEVPNGTTILMNMKEEESTIELVYETQIILNEFWKRPDLRSGYLDLKNLPKGRYVVIDSPQFPRKYSKNELINIFGKEYYVIEKSSNRLILNTPLEITKKLTKKIFKYFVYKERIDSDGLYTYYYNYSDWYFFNEK
ncbi:MAG: hypothetical protein GYA62_16580 [Bacteroidales bacterium]|nr:hypothetical protein [Bacteroidales bacterium]